MTSDPALARIADALDRLSPPAGPVPSFAEAEAYAWHTGPDRLEPVARVARASYFDTDGTRRIEDAAKTPEEDIALYERLKHPSNTSAPHMSPFEHVAMAAPGGRYGNFRGWRQERQDIEGQVRAGRLGKGTTNV